MSLFNRYSKSKTFIYATLIALLISAPFAYADDPVEVDIEAGQPLTQALNDFANQVDKQILFASNLVNGRTAPSVQGRHEPEAALNLLLEGSGLHYTKSSEDTYLITAAQSDSTPQENQRQQRQSNSDSSNTAASNDPVAFSGRVTDITTGGNLDGALVVIVETDQRTSTDNLGRFRFPQVRPGNYTVRVSYLGYESASKTVRIIPGQDAQLNFELGGVADLGTIQVYGQRSARALALNQERTAENSITVLSSDLLGKFPGATLAETLRRAPGITFQEDPLTGEGTNVIVRGLAPDLNQIRLDGQRLAEGSGRGRSPSIGNLLTDTIDEVTISKTLLPSQDSNGSGGLIEITTRGPLDRARRFAQFSAETEWNDDFTESDQFSGTLSGIFGSRDQFGLSASLQYRQSENQTVSYSRNLSPPRGFGQYLPLAADGSVITNPSAVSPLTPFPFEPGVDEVYLNDFSSRINSVDVETKSGTLAAQWQPFVHTDLRLSYTRTERVTEASLRSARFFAFSNYEALPVDELGGEVRGAWVWEDVSSSAPGLLGSISQDIFATETDEITDVLSFQGETSLGPWDFDYRLSSSTGERTVLSRNWSFRATGDVPGTNFFNFTPELLDPAVFGNLVNGRAISAFAPIRPGDSGLQLPLLSPAGFDLLNDPTNYSVGPFDSISVRSDPGDNTRESFAFSSRRNFFQSPLQYLEAGLEYETTRFDSLVGDGIFYFSADGNPISLTQLGLDTFRGDNLAAIGLSSGFFSPTAQDLEALFRRLDALSTGPDALLQRAVGTSTRTDPGTFTDEEELALYLQGRIDFGDFEIIGGLRYSRVDVKARSLSTPSIILEDGTSDADFRERFRRLINNEGSQTSLLPRVAVNWRPSDNFIVRGGYFQSVARPRVQDLSGNQSVRLILFPLFGLDGDLPGLLISEGNPDLEPSITHSFDLSAALYDDNAGVLEVALFYKNIEDFIEFTSNADSTSLDGVVLPDDQRFQNLPDDIFISVTKPTNNNESAEIYGVEISAERQFVQLPGWWGGFGVFANYTWTDSEKFFIFNNVIDPVAGEFVDVEVSGVPFDQSSKHSGTVALTYNKYSIDASLAYSAQSERLRRFQGFGLSAYDDSDDTLDLRIEYQFDAWNGTWRVFLAGQDLLKGTEDPDTLSYVGDSAKYYDRGTFFGGRTFIAGLSATF